MNQTSPGRGRLLVRLLLTFMKIGLFTFGGGYAMISMIESICVERKKWISHEDMMNITVLAESTPGPISINCATFVGYRQAGFWGALAATLGVILPSFGVIYAISMFLDNFLEIRLVANAFQGVKIAVGLLILDTGWNMLQKMSKNAQNWVIFLGSTIAMLLIDLFSWHFSSIGLLLLAGALSLAVYALGRRKGGGA